MKYLTALFLAVLLGTLVAACGGSDEPACNPSASQTCDGTGDDSGNGAGDGSSDGTGDGTGDGSGDGTGDGTVDFSNTQAAPGIWPISGSIASDCIQDGFAHRPLGGSDDFHPGMDTCNDNPKDIDEIDGNDNEDESGFDIHLPLDGIVTKVRLWDESWDETTCPEFCRQGNYILVRHPALEAEFGGEIVQTIYMHMAQDSVLVTEGDELLAGTTIGSVGRTGLDINTTHLHFGLLVGSDPGRINFDNYRNPLHFLPYVKDEAHAVSLSRKTDAAIFDADECPTAQDGSQEFRSLALDIVAKAPALDISKIEVIPEGYTGDALVLDIDNRINVGADPEDPDDFRQGCFAVEAFDFNESIQDYHLIVHFGGDWDGFTTYQVKLTDVRGNTQFDTFVF